MKKLKNSYLLVLVITLVFSCKTIPTKDKKIVNLELYDVICKQDSILFSQGFNQCNFEVFNTMIQDSLEFYDDRSGLNTSKKIEITAFKDRCGTDNKSRIKRTLISTEVFPLKGFGAVQTGVHGFYLPNTSKDEVIEIAKFIHIWENKNGNWSIKRIVSYDHKNVEN